MGGCNFARAYHLARFKRTLTPSFASNRTQINPEESLVTTLCLHAFVSTNYTECHSHREEFFIFDRILLH